MLTSTCVRAAVLEPGEVVKDGFFTLFESVGALEVGQLVPGTLVEDDI